MQRVILFVLFGAIIGIEAIPKIDAPCKKNDAPCFTKIANKLYKYAIAGDPALEVEIMDPVHREFLQGALATLEYKLYNTTIIGFKDCVVVNSTIDVDHHRLNFQMRCPVLDVTGGYEVKGDLFSIPIEGKGLFTLECRDYFVSVDGKIKISKRKDGKEYVALKNFIAEADLMGGMKFHLSNLFDGQKDLEDTFYRVVYENWKELSKELQVPIVDPNIKIIVINLNKILKEVSLEAIYDDKLNV